MSYQIRRLGWLPDPLDHRDCDASSGSVLRRLNQVVPILCRDVAAPEVSTNKAEGLTAVKKAAVGPLRVDLRKWCSPIENQGDIGSCTAHAVVGALEYFEKKTRGEFVDASRRFLYRVTRRYLGWEGKGDTGAFLRSAIKALRLFGAVPEQYWPYDEKHYDAEPEAFHYAYAQNFKALEYFRVPENVQDLKQVLRAGLPFVFGFSCFKSIFEEEVEATGVIPYPRKKDASAGGHAVMAVGFTDSHILIRNSWGKEWGDRGYGYLPWTYFDSASPLADDCWVLVNAAWMPEDEGEVAPKKYLKSMASIETTTTTTTPNVARPSVVDTKAEERHRPQIQVTQGLDPIRKLPLRFAVPKAALTASDEAEAPLITSTSRVSLYLKRLTLLDSFDWALFGEATNELYFIAICWDLSGDPPRVFPPKEITGAALQTYNVEKGQTVPFVGDGVQLWPAKKIVGGLYVRLVVMESDEDVKAVGRRIAAVQKAVAESPLTDALKPLAIAAGISAPVLAAVGAAAGVLTTIVAAALQEDDDDLVALFDGTYAAESMVSSGRVPYRQAGAEIELDFVIGQAAPPKAPAKAPPKAAKKKAQARR